MEPLTQKDVSLLTSDDLQTFNANGMNYLHRALMTETDHSVIESLIELKADLNVKTRDVHGNTPLLCAILHSIVSSAPPSSTLHLVELLLHHKANVNQGNTKQLTTPLIQACMHPTSSPIIIRTLLDAGADVGSRDALGGDALHYALLYSLPDDAIYTLIQHHTNVNMKTNDGQFPLFIALSNKLTNACIALVMNHANVNAVDKYNRTPLMIALKNGLPDIVIHSLLDAKADANQLLLGNRNALMEAIIHCRSIDIVKRLIDKTHNINLQDVGKQNPLLHCCAAYSPANESNSFEILQCLLAHPSIDVNVTTYGIWNALTYALRARASIPFLQKLIDAKVNINLIDTDGHTPLVVAIQYHCTVEVIQLLLDSGADIYYLFGAPGHNILMFPILKGILRPNADISNHDTIPVFKMLIEHHLQHVIDGTDNTNAMPKAITLVDEQVEHAYHSSAHKTTPVISLIATVYDTISALMSSKYTLPIGFGAFGIAAYMLLTNTLGQA